MSKKKQHTKPQVRQSESHPSTQATRKEKHWWMLVVKLALVAAVGISAVVVCDRNKVFPPSEYYIMLNYKRWEGFYQVVKSDSIDVILLGNSHIYTGIHPAMLSNLLSCNCFLLADASISVKDNYFALEEALQHSRPKLVVLETYGLCQRDADDETHDIMRIQSFDARKDRLMKLKSMPQLLSVDNYLPAWSMTLRNHNRLLQDPTKVVSTAELFYKVCNTSPYFLGDYARYTTGMTDSVAHLYDSLGAPENKEEWAVGSENMHYLQMIAQLCADNDIEFMLLTLPMYYKTVPDYADIKAHKLANLTETGIPWMDLQEHYDTARYGLNCFENNYFANIHMTYDGSLVATTDLARYIHDSLKVALPLRDDERRLGGTLYDRPGYQNNYTMRENDSTYMIILRDTVIGDFRVKDLTLNVMNNILSLKVYRQDNAPQALALDAMVTINGHSQRGTVPLPLQPDALSFKYYNYMAELIPGVVIDKVIRLIPQQ